MWVHTHFEATGNSALLTPVCYSEFSHVAMFTWWVPCWSYTRINIFKMISSMVLHISTKEWSTPVTTKGAKVWNVTFVFCCFNAKAYLASFPWINLHSFLFRCLGFGDELKVAGMIGWCDKLKRSFSLSREHFTRWYQKSNGKTFMYYRLVTNLKNFNESIRQNWKQLKSPSKVPWWCPKRDITRSFCHHCLNGRNCRMSIPSLNIFSRQLLISMFFRHR